MNDEAMAMLKMLVQGQAETNKRLDGLDAKVTDLDAKVTELTTQVSDLDTKTTDLTSDVGDLRGRVNELTIRVMAQEDDTRRTRADVTKMKLLLENETNPKIDGLFDGFTGIIEKLARIEPTVEETKEEVSLLTAVVSSHVQEIKALKRTAV